MTIAIVLVLCALLMSLLRYSLPYLDGQKDKVTEYISQQYSVDISVKSLSASWRRSGPSLVLQDVSIAKGERSPIALDVGEVFLEIDFWPSVLSLTLQSKQVVLNRLHADIELNQIQGGESEFPIVQALETIFLEQLSNFSVTNSRLTLNSEQTTKSFDIERLLWLNRGNHHQGSGQFSVQGFTNNSATFILDLYGDVDSYSGTLFAQANDIDFSAWFNEFTNLKGKLAASKGNVEAWANIDNGEITRVDGEIKPTLFNWDSEQLRLKNELSAKFAAVNKRNAWQFRVQDLQLSSDDAHFVTSIDGNYTEQEGFLFRSSNPFSLQALLPLSGLISQGLASKLAANSLDLSVDELAIQIDNSNELLVFSRINNISWQEHGNMVGASNLQAELLWHNAHGKVTVTDDDSRLFAERLFERNIALSSLHLPIYIDIQDQVRLNMDDAVVAVDGMEINTDFAYSSADSFLSLAIDIAPTAINKVPLWLPNHLMGSGAKKFLTKAFVGGGKIENATVLWHGKTGEFPFEATQTDDIINGVFQSKVDITQAEFLFSEGWPELEELDIQLLFENKSLAMTSASSKLAGVSLSNLQADIPNLTKNAVLTITAQGLADSKQLTNLMLQSTLADSLGKLLDSDVVIDGNLATDLKLSIPLSDGSKTRATGKVYLSDNSVTLPTLDIRFNDAKGVVAFDNENISVSDLSASFLQQAVKVNLIGAKADEHYELGIDVFGDWQAQTLANYVSDDFAKYFSGNSAWALDLGVRLGKGDFAYDALLSSELTGTASTLPAPFTKSEASARTLLLAAKGDNTASSIELNILDIAKFDGALAHKEKQFNRAHLSIGPTEFESRGVGFSISGKLERVDFSEWFDVISALTANATSVSNGNGNTNANAKGKGIIQVPQRIFIDAEKFTILGETLNDVDLRAKRLDDQWSLELGANEVRTAIVLHDDWYSKGINVDAEYVRLSKPSALDEQMDAKEASADESASKGAFDPKTLPSLKLTCKSCSLYGFDLGRLELEAEPNDDGLKINQLIVNNKFGSVNTSGQWYKRNQDHFTFLAGDLFSSDFGEFLKLMGFDSGIKDSRANMTFALTWADSPFDIKFEHLDGQIDWRLSDGNLTEVSDKGSRIFTLLSLNSLVRKLSLDFRDVFAKGFFYDNMQGSLQITEGKADTRDTNIDGAAGEIEIYGYTDLASQELNYNVSFTPNVTGNLPVLVYFFTVSPPSALAALALDQVLTSTKVISNVNYSVTGTIAEPILIETGRESTEVELPARREVEPTNSDKEFIPPDESDLIDIQVDNHGQSD